MSSLSCKGAEALTCIVASRRIVRTSSLFYSTPERTVLFRCRLLAGRAVCQGSSAWLLRAASAQRLRRRSLASTDANTAAATAVLQTHTALRQLAPPRQRMRRRQRLRAGRQLDGQSSGRLQQMQATCGRRHQIASGRAICLLKR
jgi:hypothetical protein